VRWEKSPRAGGVRFYENQGEETDEDGAPQNRERDEREGAHQMRAFPLEPPRQPEETDEDSGAKDKT
jgi:hypothetical protein